MKIRILNGGHQVLANAGEILSQDHISACMAHPLISSFFRKVASDEVAPHVAPVPGMTPRAYVDLIDERFSNPEIVDTVRRVAFDGSSRHTGFVLPVIRDALAAGAPVQGLALAEAMWARMCEGTREDGSSIEPNDPFWNSLQKTAVQARMDPRAWLSQRQYYGTLLESRIFEEAFSQSLAEVWENGAEAALAKYLAQPAVHAHA
jgi:mannitol 2-dehydrogenase